MNKAATEESLIRVALERKILEKLKSVKEYADGWKNPLEVCTMCYGSFTDDQQVYRICDLLRDMAHKGLLEHSYPSAYYRYPRIADSDKSTQTNFNVGDGTIHHPTINVIKDNIPSGKEEIIPKLSFSDKLWETQETKWNISTDDEDEIPSAGRQPEASRPSVTSNTGIVYDVHRWLNPKSIYIDLVVTGSLSILDKFPEIILPGMYFALKGKGKDKRTINGSFKQNSSKNFDYLWDRGSTIPIEIEYVFRSTTLEDGTVNIKDKVYMHILECKSSEPINGCKEFCIYHFRSENHSRVVSMKQELVETASSLFPKQELLMIGDKLQALHSIVNRHKETGLKRKLSQLEETERLSYSDEIRRVNRVLTYYLKGQFEVPLL